MNTFKTLTALTLVAGLVLTGCGSSDNTATEKSSAASTATSANTASTADAASKVKTGVTDLLRVTADLKKAIAAGDDAHIKEYGPKLEDTWSTFEDDLKPKYPDFYEEIEKSLNPEVAGSKAATLDKSALGKLNDELTATLTKLNGQLK